MPLHVSSLSRRDFLVRGAAGVAGLSVFQLAGAAETADHDSFSLLSDTHIPESEDVTARDVNMTENLRRVVARLREMPQKTAGVIINGDCAYLKGLPADYANLAQCLQPLARDGWQLHLTMGNHDDRGPFYDALSDQKPDSPPVESKHVSIIETPRANLFLLDSLFEVNVVTGELGAAQRKWFAEALDRHSDKPAIVFAHHNPQFAPPADNRPWSGLKDSEDFFQLLTSRPHVKAYVFGHTHNWSIDRHEGIHLINLPPVAYVFSEDKPNGWVHADIYHDRIELQLKTHDPDHPQSDEKVRLDWR